MIIQNLIGPVEVSGEFSHHMLMDRMWAAPTNPLGCGRCTQSGRILWTIPNVIKVNIHNGNVFIPTLELVPNVFFVGDSRNVVNNSMDTPAMENQ